MNFLLSIGGALVLIPCFFYWFGMISIRHVADWDTEISRWCHRPGMRRLWFLLTRLGDGWLYAAVFFGLRNHGEGVLAEHVAACVFVAWAVCSLLKMLFRRKRQNPVWATTQHRLRTGKLQMLSTWNSWSFPSQHAACAVAFAYALWPNPFGVLLAIAVSCSRVLIGSHYLGDVLAGVAVGLLAGRLA